MKTNHKKSIITFLTGSKGKTFTVKEIAAKIKASEDTTRKYLKILVEEKIILSEKSKRGFEYWVHNQKTVEKATGEKKKIKPYHTGSRPNKGYKWLRDTLSKGDPVLKKTLAEKLGVEPKLVPTKIWILCSPKRSKEPMNISYDKETRCYQATV